MDNTTKDTNQEYSYYTLDLFEENFKDAQTFEQKKQLIENLLDSDLDLSDPEVKERLAEYNAQLKDYWDDMKLEENNAIEQGIADGTYQLYTCIKDIDRYKQGYNYYVYIIPLKNQYQSTGIADISDELAEYISKIQDLIWIVSDNGIGTLKTKSLFSIELRENFNEYFTKL